MITQIYGGPGTGKTSLMTHFAIQAMIDPDIRRADLRGCRELVAKLNEGGYNLTVPDKHLVYADYHIMARKHPYIASYEIDGHKVGLPNNERAMHFFPPFSHIFIDEGQRKLNSREGGIREDYKNHFYEIHRHAHLNITIASQRMKLIDLNVRELADKIIEVLSMENKFDKYGCLVKSTWTCIEFDNCFAVEQYLSGGKKDYTLGKKVKFTHEGNIFKHYDSYGCMSAFFRGNYNKDFDRTLSTRTDFSVESMRRYNEAHPLTKPKVE